MLFIINSQMYTHVLCVVYNRSAGVIPWYVPVHLKQNRF